MSASKDKILRREQRQAGIDKKAEALAKEAAERRKTNRTYTIAAVVFVVLVALIFFINSPLPSRMTTAVTIDGEEYSVAEVNYYYSNAYQNFVNTYYDYVQYGMLFDTTQSLADQAYSEDMSWRDFFMDYALQDMAEIQALCKAAEAAGFEMPEDYQATYEDNLASLETIWISGGYSSLEQFINLCYGKGVDEELVKNEIYRSIYANAYANSVYDGYEYSTEELTTYYAEHADELDFLDYTYYYFIETEGEEEEAEAKAAALLEAVNGTDEATFIAAMAENFDGAEPYDGYAQGTSLSTVYGEWLLEDGRQAGEATMIQSDTGSWYVVMFHGRDNNDYPARSFRHILINAQDTDGDGLYSDEEVQAATEAAEQARQEWLAGTADEDSFATLANLVSEDSGSNTNGGLYENVFKGQMVSPVNDWLFNTAAEVGDNAVVTYNEGGSYTGAHILYYAGESDTTYALELADSAMRSEAFNTWSEGLGADQQVETSHLGMAGKNY